MATRLPNSSPYSWLGISKFSNKHGQLTLGLFFITTSGQQHQTYNQVVEVKPLCWASEWGVDHLKWDAESVVCEQQLAISRATTTRSACWQKPFSLCRRWHMSNGTRDSWVLKQWVGLRHLFASTDLIWHCYKKKTLQVTIHNKKRSNAVAPIIPALIWSHALLLCSIFQI